MHNYPHRKTLIADLDNCSFTTNQEVNGKLLSRQFVAHAKQVQYAEFYVCTHRTADNFETHLLDPIRLIQVDIERNQAYQNQAAMRETYGYASKPFFTEEHLSHVFTHKIIEHLEQETGLSCVAVSTPGDVHQCGEAYLKIIKPLEIDAIKKNYDLSAFEEVEWIAFDTNSKNRQLMQVIMDALARYPEEQHVFDFVDDRLELCQAALKLCDKLPKNVMLNIFHHDAFDSTRLQQINNLPKTQNNYCNFFTKVAVVTTGLVTAAYVVTQSFRP
jgi:hypothetical protein